jgi:transcription elongation factor Elf1
MELEHFFQCPHCWSEISMILDASVSQQVYIEDCEVCCNPIEVTPTFEEAELVGFYAQSIEQ